MKRVVVLLVVIMSLCAAGLALESPANLLANGDFNQSDPQGEDLALGWKPAWDGYVRIREAGADNAEILLEHEGDDSRLAGAYQAIACRQKVHRPIRVTVRLCGQGIENDPKDIFGVTPYAVIETIGKAPIYSKNSVKTKIVGSPEWTLAGFNTATLTDDPITTLTVYALLGRVKGSAYFDGYRAEEIPLEGRVGAVTFMFDDGRLSVLTEALSLLQSRGWRGTIAPVTDYLRADSKSGYLNFAQLFGLVSRNGWSVVSHGVSHRPLDSLSLGDMEDEFHDSLAFFRTGGISVRHFALPYGDYDGEVYCRSQWYVSTLRTVERGDNPYGAFPYGLRMQEGLRSTVPAEYANWLAHARDFKRWLILVFHDIDHGGGGNYGVSSQQLAAVIEQVVESGLPVITYDEGVTRFVELGPQKNAVNGWQRWE